MTTTSITKSSTAQVEIKLTEKAVEILLIALKPEAETPSSERSTVKLSRDEDKIKILVVANDTTALRAALNSYLRWIQGILNMIEDIE